jgi:hypothetical protein
MRLASILIILCLSTTALAETTEKPKVLGPGDYKYMHEELHPHFEKLFGEGKCHCKTGYCRPTVYRLAPNSVGVEIKIDGGWYAPPQSAMLQKNQIPPELWHFDALVCAHPTSPGEYDIECVTINSGV